MCRAGYSSAGGRRYTFSHGKQVTEIFRYRDYLAPKISGTMVGKNPEMFRPIAVRNRLTTPHGRKVLGNLKQCTVLEYMPASCCTIFANLIHLSQSLKHLSDSLNLCLAC